MADLELRKSERLQVSVEDNELVIRIGVDTLAFAFEHSDYNYKWNDDLNAFVKELQVERPGEFALDVLQELVREAEDGSTILTRLLDEACIKAVENGSTAMSDGDEGE